MNIETLCLNIGWDLALQEGNLYPMGPFQIGLNTLVKSVTPLSPHCAIIQWSVWDNMPSLGEMISHVSLCVPVKPGLFISHAFIKK